MELSSVEEAQAAIENLVRSVCLYCELLGNVWFIRYFELPIQNDSELKGRRIIVREARDPPAKDSGGGGGGGRAQGSSRGSQSRRIVVENIPEGFGWRELKDLAKPFGFVRHADVVRRDGQGTVGVLQFDSDEDANAAISRLNGQVCMSMATVNIRLCYDNRTVMLYKSFGYDLYV